MRIQHNSGTGPKIEVLEEGTFAWRVDLSLQEGEFWLPKSQYEKVKEEWHAIKMSVSKDGRLLTFYDRVFTLGINERWVMDDEGFVQAQVLR